MHINQPMLPNMYTTAGKAACCCPVILMGKPHPSGRAGMPCSGMFREPAASQYTALLPGTTTDTQITCNSPAVEGDMGRNLKSLCIFN